MQNFFLSTAKLAKIEQKQNLHFDFVCQYPAFSTAVCVHNYLNTIQTPTTKTDTSSMNILGKNYFQPEIGRKKLQYSASAEKGIFFFLICILSNITISCIQLFRPKSVKAYATMPIGIKARKSLALID